MTRPILAGLLSLAVFALSYGLAADASSWFSIYRLHSWDTKFGSPAGNLAFAREVLPLFVVIGLLSHLAGLLSQWRWLADARLTAVAGVAAGVGVLAVAIWAALALLTAGVPTRSAWNGIVNATTLFWLLFGPGLLTAALATLARRSRGAAIDQAAV